MVCYKHIAYIYMYYENCHDICKCKANERVLIKNERYMKKQTNLNGFTKSDLGVKSLDKCIKVECSNVGVFATTLENVCNGTFITFKPLDYPTDVQVYQKEYYDRSEKKYVCDRYNASSSEKHYKGNKLVYINFNY